MAGASLLTLLDDVATLLDDVAVLGKVAAQKTTGVLGDDLALNAQQLNGIQADRELPVVWAVAKGSFLNKAILVPVALAINAIAPWAVTPLLMVGGAYLCYEGFEKIVHKLTAHRAEDEAHHADLIKALTSDDIDIVAFEKEQIKGAIRTDFVLSAEIIAITLGIVQTSQFVNQVVILSGIAILMTVGVYGFVAGIVKLDDLGLYLSQRPSVISQRLGQGLLVAAPWIMKCLTVVGTIAMFLVGGGILVHGIPALHHAIETAAASSGYDSVISMTANALVGLVSGALVLLVMQAFGVLGRRIRHVDH